MWKHHTALLALTVVLCHSIMPLSAQINAQDTAANPFPAKWGLQDCLDYALKNNITINTARLNLRSADQDLLQARAGVLPNLTGNASDYLTFQRRINSSGNYGNRSFSESGNYGLNSSVTIYQGGYIHNNIREKQLYQQTAGLDILQSENDITLNVTQDFLNILLAKENIVYFQDLLNTSQSQVQQAKLKYDAGAIALKDLVELQAQTANDKYSLVTAQNTHRQNIIALKLLLQLPSEVPFQALEPDTLIAKNAVTDLGATQQQAMAVRPEIKLSDAEVDIARTDLQLARSGYLPVLQGTGAFGASHSGGDPGVFQQLDNAFYQQIGLTLSVPIFTRPRHPHQRREGKDPGRTDRTKPEEYPQQS